MKNTKNQIRIFALGGLGEIGKNCYCLEYRQQIYIVDCGILFPDEQLHGIDYIIPDFEYLELNQDRIVGLFITHGHEDHIGGVGFLLKKVKIPKIYASGIALELLKSKLQEQKVTANLIEYKNTSIFTFSQMTLSFIRVTHSIPDSFALVFKTHLGNVVFSGDFKIDLTPVGPPVEFEKILEVSRQGVLCLLSDSTNAELEGFTTSEKKVGDSIKDLFKNIEGRVIIATFASNVYRIQQIVEASVISKRKILVFGRSMEKTIEIGQALGYIKAPKNTFIEISDINRYNASELTLICTGSQGEAMAALSRIANGSHRQIKLLPGDTVIFSSSPIPGNAQFVNNTINLLFKRGTNVITNSPFTDTHTSGHAGQGEQKLLITLFKPKFFIPVHGEYRMLKLHAETGIQCGVEKDHSLVMENGQVLTISEDGFHRNDRVKTSDVYIDGHTIGNISSNIIRERKTLSEEGLVSIIFTLNFRTKELINEPSIVSKGFIYMKSSEEISKKIIAEGKRLIQDELRKHPTLVNVVSMRNIIAEAISRFILELTDRKPLIIPIFMSV